MFKSLQEFARYLPFMQHKEPDGKQQGDVEEYKEYVRLGIPQSTEIARIVREQAMKSQGFGLDIDETLQKKEIHFFLRELNARGSLSEIAQTVEFSDLWRSIIDKMGQEFAVETTAYFDYFSSQPIKTTNTKYNVHLEACLSGILQTIYY